MKKYLLILTIIFLIPFVYAEECCPCPINESTNETIEQNNTTETNETQINQTETNKTIELPEGHCNVSLKLETNKLKFQNKEKIKIYNKLSSKKYQYEIDYWIENKEGKIIKKVVSTKNTNLKQYTPNFQFNTTLIIKNNLSFIDCKNINNQTYNELEVFVEGDPPQEPNLTIKLNNNTIKLGEILNITIAIYSGNNKNYTITQELETISNKTYIINNKYNYTVFNTSIKIPNNCSITGYYYLTLKANNLEEKKEINIINNCTNQTEINETSTIQTENENSSENIINFEGSPLTGKTIYESTNIKAKTIATYLVMAILAAIVIYIISTNKKTEKILKKQTKNGIYN